MTNTQLFFAAGMPTLAVLIGILVNRMDVSSLRTELHAGMASLRTEISQLRTEFNGRIDLLTGKVIELTDRVSHLEARIGK
ncbi:MAG TPA: hypothetical protein VHB45_15760 [Alloacidobacterium sp.]|nr:hypothetical protein [Alloacidobacterium sp.]